jgi:dephospho-CoA kinase
MVKVGVTGGAGSGKTLVLEFFRRLGAGTINLDELARQAVQPGSLGLEKVATHFGREILASDGTLDRGKLRRMIIADQASRRQLEALIHPRIFQLYEDELARIDAHCPASIVAVEVALLAELGLQAAFDCVVLVEARQDLQTSRVAARDGVSIEEARALLATQLPPGEKRVIADYVIENTGTIQDLEQAAGAVYEKIVQEFKKG